MNLIYTEVLQDISDKIDALEVSQELLDEALKLNKLARVELNNSLNEAINRISAEGLDCRLLNEHIAKIIAASHSTGIAERRVRYDIEPT